MKRIFAIHTIKKRTRFPQKKKKRKKRKEQEGINESSNNPRSLEFMKRTTRIFLLPIEYESLLQNLTK